METNPSLAQLRGMSIDPFEPYYAGFWIRLAAALIDTVVLYLLPFLLSYIVDGRVSSKSGQVFLSPMDVIIYFVIPGIATIYLWHRLRATPGKLILGIMIVDADTGKSTTWRQAVIRYLGYFVSLIPLGFGMFWAGIDPRKQGWHDKMANTVVIRTEAKTFGRT